MTVLDAQPITDAPAMTNVFSMRVSMGDTDAAGVVFMIAPARWAEIGFEDLLRDVGMPLETILPRDLHYPVVSITIDHFASLTLGRAVTVRTGVVRVGGRSVEILSTVTDDEAGVVACTVRRVCVARSRSGEQVTAEDWFRRMVCSAASLGMPAEGREAS